MKATAKQRGGVTGKGFVPGASGNPTGQKRGIGTVKALAREWTEAAVRRLAHIMEHGKSEKAQAFAAVSLLDRGWGKPAQHLEVEARAALMIVHRTPDHDPLAPKPDDEERVLNVTALPVRALRGPTP